MLLIVEMSEEQMRVIHAALCQYVNTMNHSDVGYELAVEVRDLSNMDDPVNPPLPEVLNAWTL